MKRIGRGGGQESAALSRGLKWLHFIPWIITIQKLLISVWHINYGVFNLSSVVVQRVGETQCTTTIRRLMVVWVLLPVGLCSRGCRMGQTRHFLPPPPKAHTLVMWLKVFTSPSLLTHTDRLKSWALMGPRDSLSQPEPPFHSDGPFDWFLSLWWCFPRLFISRFWATSSLLYEWENFCGEKKIARDFTKSMKVGSTAIWSQEAYKRLYLDTQRQALYFRP